MKRVHLILLFMPFIAIFQFCSTDTSKKTTESEAVSSNSQTDTLQGEEQLLTNIEFEEKTYDFGQIKEGQSVSHNFKFKNTGENPLVVKSVKTSCGCTASDYTKTQVAPGEYGNIDIVFNSSGRPGPNHKSLTVVANTQPKTTVLTFNAEVLKSE
ncbi:MAG: DUF1573 domain-containing protein [Bacteroidales bacterium]|nr:DUF1573 domain-containing protein [Bacteroidales bacterium]